MADYLTRAQLVDRIEKGIHATRGSKETLAQYFLDMVYNEVLSCDPLYPLFWMLRFNDSIRTIAPMDITGISQASPGVVTVANTLSNGDVVTIYNIGGMTELNGRNAVVTGVNSSQFSLYDMDGTAIDTSGMTAYTSGGTVHHRGAAIDTSPRRIVGAKWIDESAEGMKPILHDDLEKGTLWTDTIGEPKRFMHQKRFADDGTETNRLLWFCAPDAVYRLRYWYEYEAPRLTEATDVPLLPHRNHDVLICGALARAAESNAQVENAVVWPGLYQMGLDQIRAYNREYWQRNEELKPPYML